MSKEEQLEAIKKRIEDEMVCPLKEAATNIVFGKGNPSAPILFIGEAPGKNEDLQGEPFVGAAGKELDKMLQKIDLSLETCYIANILKYRPPNNRDPTPEEIRRHTPYLIEQIKVIEPKVIITLGNFSTKFVLAGFDVDGMKTIAGMTQLHGKPVDLNVNHTSFKLIPMFHPAAILYKPTLRETFEEDFEIVRKLLGEQDTEEQKGQQTLAGY